jgi:D-sedoheptulose 7-phosphate isomerase
LMKVRTMTDLSNNQSRVLKELTEAQQVLTSFLEDKENLKQIESIAETMADAIKSGGKIFSCGNGGSHCDAMHFAEELSGRYRESRKALPAIAISDPSHVSCVANDFGYEYVFSRFIEGLGNKGDVLLAISTSGNSPNIIQAVATAKQLGMKTVLLSGKDGGRLAGEADHEIIVPHFGYADRVQEVHIKIIHSLIMLIEDLTKDL